MEENRDRTQQVWLPSSGVWAALPASAESSGARSSQERRRDNKKRSREPSTHSGDRPKQRQEQHPAAAPAAVAPPETKRPHYTGFELQQDKDTSDVEDAEEYPTCPICLVDIVELADKAVVTTCMHTFCHSCIDRWLSHHKRICPLCKQRVSSVIYDITSVGTYREREVPPSPKLVTTGSRRDDADAGLPLLQRLQDFLGVAGLLDPYEQQQLGQERGRGSGVGGGAARRLRTEAGSGRPGSRHGAQPPGSAPAAGGGQAGPRPYFWRLQQRLQAGAYRPGGAATGVGGATAEGPVSEHDYVLLWRRQIYDQDLWAVPLGSEPAHISLGSGSARERRLTEWIDRELQALLQTDDTTIVRGFVMGLLVAYGLDPPDGRPQPGSQAGGTSPGAAASAASRRAAEMVAAAQRGRGVAGVAARPDGGGGSSSSGGGSALSSSPQEALRPFLHEQAEHFWHELRCFATAPYNLATYDRMVTYLRRQAELGVQAAAGGGSGGVARASRWDQPQRGTASAPQSAGRAALAQQQRWGSRAVQPARVVVHASRPWQQQGQGQRQGPSRPADAEVPRRGGAGGDDLSRNPSPPPLAKGMPAVPGDAPAQQVQQAQQAQQAQQPRVPAAMQHVPVGARRSRSRSRSRSRDRRQRQARSRSRSRSRWLQLGRRSRSRSRRRSQDRREDRHKCPQRRRSSGHRRQRRRSSSRCRRLREHSLERSDERHCSGSTHGGYIVGDSDAGDRWHMQ